MNAVAHGPRSRMRWLHGGDGDPADPARVGKKAANLMRMARAGLRVPPGFVLDTDECAAYHERGGHLDQTVRNLVADGLREIERTTGRRFWFQRCLWSLAALRRSGVTKRRQQR